MKPVCVLGSGPAGLLSAWALMMCGVPTVVVSNGGKSRLGGAQFLHAPIPGITKADVPDTVIKITRRGNPEEYRRKAFGALEVPWIPWAEDWPIEREAWSLSRVYDLLWEHYGGAVEMNRVSSVTLDWVNEKADLFSGFISSVPLKVLCRKPTEHRFITQDIRVHPDTFEPSIAGEDHVVLDGTRDKSWYRASCIFGQSYTEWGHGAKRPPGLDTFPDYKPISTTCNCLAGSGVLPVGRRGKWNVSELTHNAFYDTMTLIGTRYGR